jgi:hypothetical protein
MQHMVYWILNFYNLLWFAFLVVILVLWPTLWVQWVNLVISIFFLSIFKWYIFFNFIIQHPEHLLDYGLCFLIFFNLFSIKLPYFHDLDHESCELICVNLNCFIVSLFRWIFFQFYHLIMSLLKLNFTIYFI